MPTYYLNPSESRWAAWYLTFDVLSDEAKLTHAEQQAENSRYLGSWDAERLWRTVVSMLRAARPAAARQALAS